MVQKAKRSVSHKRISNTTKEYAIQRDLHFIEERSQNQKNITAYISDSSNQKADKIHNNVKFTSTPRKYRKTHGARRKMHSGKCEFRSLDSGTVYNLENTSYFRVGAPNPPDSPSDFPDPKGQPAPKPKNKKG